MTQFVNSFRNYPVGGSYKNYILNFIVWQFRLEKEKHTHTYNQGFEVITNNTSLVQIAGKINKIIRELGLKELGQLEQDLVFGDAGTKELINFLRTKQVRMVSFV